jgi:anaerobic ribonucleoside-triphosphate reductase activating protein
MPSENEPILRIHRFLPETEVEGPGRRAALWVQGCPIRCPGCANEPTWSFEGGCQMSVAGLFDEISRQPRIEGVTFIGGEPFSQASALAALGRLCRAHSLSVVTFTGYEYTHLIAAGRPDWNALLAITDLLLAGPFKEDQRDFSRPWIGSRNQEVVFLTDRYRRLEEQGFSSKNGLEVQIGSNGRIRLNGLAPVEEIGAFRRELSSLGLQTN